MSVKSFNSGYYNNNYPRLEQHVKTKGWSIRPGLKLVSLREDLAFKVWPNKKKQTYYVPPGRQVAFSASNTYPDHVSLTKSNAKTNFVIHYEEEEEEFENENDYFVESVESDDEKLTEINQSITNQANISYDECNNEHKLISVLKKPGNTNLVKKKVVFSDSLEVEETDEDMSTSVSSN